MNLYEVLGRKEERIAQLEETAAAALGVIRKLKTGELSLDAVTVTDERISIDAPLTEPVPIRGKPKEKA